MMKHILLVVERIITFLIVLVLVLGLGFGFAFFFFHYFSQRCK